MKMRNSFESSYYFSLIGLQPQFYTDNILHVNQIKPYIGTTTNISCISVQVTL